MKAITIFDFPKSFPGKEELNIDLPCLKGVFTLTVGEEQNGTELFERAFEVRGRPKNVAGVWAYSSEQGEGYFLLTGEKIWLMMPDGFCDGCKALPLIEVSVVTI